MDDAELLIPKSILEEFQSHCTALRKSYSSRKDAVVLRNVVEDKQEYETISVQDTLGRRQPTDVYSGDVNLRTLRLLLKMIDNRGWERYVDACNFALPFALCVSHARFTLSGLTTKWPSIQRLSAASRVYFTRTSGRHSDRQS